MPGWVTCSRCGGGGVIGADLWDGTGVRCDGCAGTGSTADDGQTGDLLRALTITGRLMRSTDTGHTARQSADGWGVSWLPGTTVRFCDLITAHAGRPGAGSGSGGSGRGPDAGAAIGTRRS